MSTRTPSLSARNLKAAELRWGSVLTHETTELLTAYSEQFAVSIAAGDLILLDAHWYVTHSGLLRLARRNRCHGIHVRPAASFCNPVQSRWAFRAIVYKSRTCRGFVGYGDADPSNTSAKVRGAEMRVAETRAVNRALRKAYGIGICSVEELGSFSGPLPPIAGQKVAAAKAEHANGNGHHPLRDRLCTIIRQHRLDAALVKAFAADYCEVAELRQASREQIAAFSKHLAEYAVNDRDGLLCQLNSYAAKPVAPAESTAVDAGEAKIAGAA